MTTTPTSSGGSKRRGYGEIEFIDASLHWRGMDPTTVATMGDMLTITATTTSTLCGSKCR